MIVPELPAEIAELKQRIGRFIEKEVYPAEQRIAERNAIDPGEVDALRAKLVKLEISSCARLCFAFYWPPLKV